MKRKAFVFFPLLIIAWLTLRIDSLPASKKVVEKGEGFKIIETSEKRTVETTRFDPRIREVKCESCGAFVSRSDTRCPKCSAILSGRYYIEEAITVRTVSITTRDAVILQKLASTHENADVRAAALAEIKQASHLQDVYVSTRYPEERDKIVARISDPTVLQDLNKLFPQDLNVESRYHRLILQRIEQMTDEPALRSLIRDEEAAPIPRQWMLDGARFRLQQLLRQSIAQMTDESALLSLIHEERTSTVPRPWLLDAAEERLSQMQLTLPADPISLKELLLQTPSRTIAAQALAKLSDSQLLRDVVLHAYLPDARKLALRRPFWRPEIYLKVLESEMDIRVIHEALLGLEYKKSDPEIARKIFSALSRFPELQFEGDGRLIRIGFEVAKLTGEHEFVLKVIPHPKAVYENSHSFSSPSASLDFLTDESLLARIIAENTYATGYRIDAVWQIRDAALLRKLLATNLPVPIHNACLRRIEAIEKKN